MDRREISARLHDILGAAHRVRQAVPGQPAEEGVERIDAVKVALRALIVDLGGEEPSRLPPRRRATAAAFPEGRVAGTRATVQHRRHTRAVRQSGAPAEALRIASAGSLGIVAAVSVRTRPTPRVAAEAAFARLTDKPAVAAAAAL